MDKVTEIEIGNISVYRFYIVDNLTNKHCKIETDEKLYIDIDNRGNMYIGRNKEEAHKLPSITITGFYITREFPSLTLVTINVHNVHILYLIKERVACLSIEGRES